MVDNEVKPHKLATGFKSWGKRVGQSYKRVVLITSAIALVLGAIAGVTFQMEDGDSTEAFTPIGNKGTEDRNRLHATFGNMDIVPTSIVISRHDGGNIVTPAEFDASLTLHRRLMAITMANQDPTTADAKPTVTYSDLCLALPTGDCLINSMLRCFGFSTPPDSMAVTDPLCLDANGVPVITRSSLGGEITRIVRRVATSHPLGVAAHAGCVAGHHIGCWPEDLSLGHVSLVVLPVVCPLCRL